MAKQNAIIATSMFRSQLHYSGDSMTLYHCLSFPLTYTELGHRRLLCPCPHFLLVPLLGEAYRAQWVKLSLECGATLPSHLTGLQLGHTGAKHQLLATCSEGPVDTAGVESRAAGLLSIPMNCLVHLCCEPIQEWNGSSITYCWKQLNTILDPKRNI